MKRVFWQLLKGKQESLLHRLSRICLQAEGREAAKDMTRKEPCCLTKYFAKI